MIVTGLEWVGIGIIVLLLCATINNWAQEADAKRKHAKNAMLLAGLNHRPSPMGGKGGVPYTNATWMRRFSNKG
jgi:hypothetical protein